MEFGDCLADSGTDAARFLDDAAAVGGIPKVGFSATALVDVERPVSVPTRFGFLWPNPKAPGLECIFVTCQANSKLQVSSQSLYECITMRSNMSEAAGSLQANATRELQ